VITAVFADVSPDGLSFESQVVQTIVSCKAMPAVTIVQFMHYY